MFHWESLVFQTGTFPLWTSMLWNFRRSYLGAVAVPKNVRSKFWCNSLSLCPVYKADTLSKSFKHLVMLCTLLKMDKPLCVSGKKKNQDIDCVTELQFCSKWWNKVYLSVCSQCVVCRILCMYLTVKYFEWVWPNWPVAEELCECN